MIAATIIFAILLNTCLCGGLLYLCICSLYRMTGETRHAIRVAYLAITLGSAYSLLEGLIHWAIPDIGAMLLSGGALSYMLSSLRPVEFDVRKMLKG